MDVLVKPTVRAAGGLVTRPSPSDRPEVLLVYRARRDDWTFPKGKLRPGEDDQTCAMREVEEETGLRCELGAELSTTTYMTRSGRRKLVRYWTMRPVAGVAAPRNEVDAIRWVELGTAAILLTYSRDRAVLAGFARLRLARAAVRRAARRRPDIRSSAGRPVGVDARAGSRRGRARSGVRVR